MAPYPLSDLSGIVSRKKQRVDVPSMDGAAFCLCCHALQSTGANQAVKQGACLLNIEPTAKRLASDVQQRYLAAPGAHWRAFATAACPASVGGAHHPSARRQQCSWQQGQSVQYISATTRYSSTFRGGERNDGIDLAVPEEDAG